MRRALAPAVLVVLVVAGCDLVNPERPTPQADVTVYGNLLELVEPASEGKTVVVRLQVGVPRALAQAHRTEGRPTPALDKGTVAEVTVGPDTVVLRGGRPAGLEVFDPGTEVVVVPVAGSTRMAGSTRLFLEAAYLTDFSTYRRWQLPGLTSEQEASQPLEDPNRINSAGIESSPIPIGDGSVLYFSARMRLPEAPDGRWLGARREGLGEASAAAAPRVRSYRTELGADGWTPPRLVEIPGLAEAAEVRVTWVSEDEAACLVTVTEGESPPWVGRSTRASRSVLWGAPERPAALGEEDASDAGYLAGSGSKLVFASRRSATSSDLYLFDPKQGELPKLLDPRVNTPGDEWAPRVGPGNELLFSRGSRQLVLKGGAVVPVRLPGAFRRELNEAMPSRDGRWLFMVVPRYTPVELDLDLEVAPLDPDGNPGEPVPVDSWRP